MPSREAEGKDIVEGRRGLPALLLAMVLLVALAAGCGEGEQEAVTIPQTTPSTATTAPVAEESVQVYFLLGEMPATVTREVEGGAPEALEELMKGPSPEEEEQGFATAIPGGTRLRSYAVEGEVATADFSGELASYGGGSAMVQAITAQITETVRANDPRVTTVVITVDGVSADEALQP
ncbi:MAG: GerMN domain-containing protein [Actinobacteria bacterium]|nr:GerMN domain-containing protein [Actinomycetota bacterium]MBU4386755.1 GerMN domain-containing protein [Actinomycetota bacterium]